MYFPEWEPIYESIIKDFGYSREKDEEAARLLHSIAGKKSSKSDVLRDIIEGNKISICGAASSLQHDLKKLTA